MTTVSHESDDPRAAVADALSGVTVVCAAVNVPGPRTAADLREMGATLIKVEPPTGDPLAVALGDGAGSWYGELADGAEIRTIDLKSAAGVAEMNELLAGADVLLTSHRPSALRRMGLADATVRFPRLCHIEIVGDVTDPERPGHDLTYQAGAGLIAGSEMPRSLFADLAGAHVATRAALALLVRRGVTGAGGHELVGLKQAAESMATPLRHGLTAPGGLLGGALPQYGIYPAEDGLVAVAALEPHFLRRLADAMSIDPAPATVAARLPEFLSSRSTKSVVRWADDHDLPVAAIT